MKAGIEQVKDEIKDEIKQVKDEVKEVKDEVKQLKVEIKEVKDEIKQLTDEVKQQEISQDLRLRGEIMDVRNEGLQNYQKSLSMGQAFSTKERGA